MLAALRRELSEPSLKRMSRSLLCGIGESKSLQVEKTERMRERIWGAGKVRCAWACDPVGFVARDKAGVASCGQILRGVVTLLRSVG